MAASEPIRNKKQLKKMAGYYLLRGQFRNHALIVLGVHTALRISDLLRLTWDDVYDAPRGEFRRHVALVERKTGKAKTIALNREAVAALRLYFPHRRGVFLFANNRKNRAAISRVQAYRIIREAAEAVGLAGVISCHSLRKTFGYHAWKNGVPAVLLMDIFNHSSFAVTRRYLGVSQDDRDGVHLKMALF
ncbi:MAG: tyrosine-type recombinase/integrase [Oscillospiraceae bacterium]|nr:tyrosine-type recombinase/integrase [Oscillospiraceae bacterium]